MRHVFILNPAAGKKHTALALREKIEAYFAEQPEMDYTICCTTAPGDATRIAAQACAQEGPVRLYACGGDGTLQETANGIPEGSCAELTVIPCGSGNDYIKIFGTKEEFLDIPDLVNGEAVPVDAVDCDGLLSLNIASIGMDAKVADRMNRYKNLPFVGGSMAYELAILDVLLHPLGDEMCITIETADGSVVRRGRFFLALAANGQYYGGGYHGAPQAVEDDGVLDFVLIKKISRLKIPAFLPKYKAGQYQNLSCCEHIRGSAMTVKAARPACCNVDGECSNRMELSFVIRPQAFRFVLPRAVAQRRKKNRAEREPAAL